MTKFNKIYNLLLEIYGAYIKGNHLLKNNCLDLSSEIRQEKYKNDWKIVSNKRLAESIFRRENYYVFQK